MISSRSTLDSCSSITTTPSSPELSSLGELILSDYSDESSDEDCEVVPAPFKTHFVDHIPLMQSPQLSVSSSYQSSPTATPQIRTDVTTKESCVPIASNIVINSTNPSQQLTLQSRSPSIDVMPTDLLSVGAHAFFAYEVNRLDSFKKQNRETFAHLKVEELAYAGFYLNSEGTAVQCSWCIIRLSKQQFEDILNQRPPIPGSPLNDEPWTAMRVHRHEYGQYTNKDISWCPFVRREKGGFYPNVSMVLDFR